MNRLDNPSDKNIEKLLQRAEKYAREGSVPTAIFERIQQAIDSIDEELEEPDYRLYETQALLYYATEDYDNAIRFYKDALVLNDNPKTYTRTSRLLLKEYLSPSNPPNRSSRNQEIKLGDDSDDYDGAIDSTSPLHINKHLAQPELNEHRARYSGKLEGWLALYTLRLVLIPIIFLIDLVSSNTGTSDLSSDLKFYLLFASVGDVIFIVFSLVMWGAFFKKKIRALNLKYFEMMLAQFYLIGGLWLAVLYDNNDLEGSSYAGKLIAYSLGSLLWFFYWIRSKRVKATFVNE